MYNCYLTAILKIVNIIWFHLTCFVNYINISTSLEANFVGVMLGVEPTYKKCWKFLCLKFDSQFVNLTFKNKKIVPWNLVAR